MQLIIRRATTEDSEVISGLSRQLGYPAKATTIRKRLSKLLDSDAHQVFVAVIDNTLVGWIHGFYSLQVESDPFVEIGGLVVHEKHRKKGIGTALITAIDAWAKEKECAKLRVRSNVVRKESQRFYEKLWFVLNKKQNVFDRKLSI